VRLSSVRLVCLHTMTAKRSVV